MLQIPLILLLMANAVPPTRPEAKQEPEERVGAAHEKWRAPERRSKKSAPSEEEFEKPTGTTRANVELGFRSLPASVTGTPHGENFLYVLPSATFEAPTLPFALTLQVPLSIVPLHGVFRFHRYAVRGHDWDQPSNYGQIVKQLAVGQPGTSALAIRAGQMDGYSLGLGYLVQNYDNRVALGYAPLSVEVTVAAGGFAAVRLFASDAYVPNQRILALETAFKIFKRVELAPSVVWDSGGRDGVVSEALSASALGAQVHILNGKVRWSVTGGLGTRWDEGSPELGMTVGTTVGAGTDTSVQAHVEQRWNQSDHFRFGLIGADYELRRALAGQPQDARPQTLYAELALQIGGARSRKAPRLRLSMATEGWGDGVESTNVSVSADLLGGQLSAAARWVWTTLAERPYHHIQTRITCRVNRYGLYVWLSGGTVHSLLPASAAPDAPPQFSVASGFTGLGGAGVQFGN